MPCCTQERKLLDHSLPTPPLPISATNLVHSTFSYQFFAAPALSQIPSHPPPFSSTKSPTSALLPSPPHMPLRIALLIYLLFLSLPSSHSFPTQSLNTFTVFQTNASVRPGSVAHCECRCCRYTSHMRHQCDDHVNIVPLTPSFSCDARMSSRHDQFVCGVAMCHAHFPDQCLPPSFISHACVSDRGFIRDWAPLFFVCVMLAVLAYVFRHKAAQGPQVDANHLAHLHNSYKRSAVMSPSAMVLQPLSSAPQVTYDGSDRPFEILDVGPRSPGLNPRRAATPQFSMLPAPPRIQLQARRDSLAPLRAAGLAASQLQTQSTTNDQLDTGNRDAVT